MKLCNQQQEQRAESNEQYVKSNKQLEKSNEQRVDTNEANGNFLDAQMLPLRQEILACNISVCPGMLLWFRKM